MVLVSSGTRGKWVAASVPSVLYVLLNGLTVTQLNTLETDGYLGGKGQRQSFTPFYLPLCHVFQTGHVGS